MTFEEREIELSEMLSEGDISTREWAKLYMEACEDEEEYPDENNQVTFT